MIKLGQLLKEIEVIRPFNGRITNVQELESYLNFLERKEGKGIYGNKLNMEDLIKDYERYDTVSIPENIKSLYNLKYVEGDLSLIECKNITSLPNNLNIGKNLICKDTPLSKQYSSEEIEQMIIDKDGSVQEVIIDW
jgi:hypothetical protein